MESKVARRRYELSDEEWKKLEKYFPLNKKGRPAQNKRTVMNGILWIARSGAPWRDLPERYGKWNSVYVVFVKWQQEGILEQVFNELKIEAELSELSIDSTCVKAHPDSSGAKKGLVVMKSTNILE